MKYKSAVYYFIVMVLALISADAFAEIIYLKDGQVLKEKITEKTDQYIMTDTDMGFRKYYTGQIERIEEDPLPVIEHVGNISQDKARLIVTFIEVSGVSRNVHHNIDQVISQSPLDQQQELRELFVVDEVLKRMIPVYDKYYTEEDLNAIIRFYQSPAGQKVLESTPRILEEAAEVSVKYLKEKMAP